MRSLVRDVRDDFREEIQDAREAYDEPVDAVLHPLTGFGFSAALLYVPVALTPDATFAAALSGTVAVMMGMVGLYITTAEAVASIGYLRAVWTGETAPPHPSEVDS